MIPIVFYAIILFFSSCKGSGSSIKQKEKCNNCGSALWKHRILDQNTGKFITPINERDRKIWFMDSLIIAEGSHVDINRDEYGKETYHTYVGEYTFIDLRTRTFYEYQTFSDTATIVDSYKQPDTGRNKRGWNFFSTKSLWGDDNFKNLPDTIIGNMAYKRILGSKIIDITNPVEQKEFGKQQEILQIGYLKCDSTKTGLSLDKVVEIKTGCSVLRFDQISSSYKSYLVTEIEFVSTKLTDEEIKVFDAWKKYAKDRPVYKK